MTLPIVIHVNNPMTKKLFIKQYNCMPAAVLAGMTVVCMLIFLTPSAGWAKQDNNPIFGQVTPEQVKAEKGSTVSVTVCFWTERLFPRMTLQAKIPKGLSLAAGKTVQEFRDFKPGEKRFFNFSFNINSSEEQRVFFTATALDLIDETISQVMTVIINPKDSDKSFIETDKSGKGYRIYGIQ